MGLGWKIAAWPIRYKLLGAYATALSLAMLAGYFAVFVQVQRTIVQNTESELESSIQAISGMVRAGARVSVRTYLRGLAEASHGYAGSMLRLAREGSIDAAEARSRALDFMLRQKIGPSGYTYVLDSKGVLLAHPSPELEGRDMSATDIVRRSMQQGRGYIEYDWQNPGEPEPRNKAVYVSFFEPWGWYISVSAYRDEFTRLIQPRDFGQSVGAIELGRGGFVCVLGAEGDAIVGHERSGLLEAEDPEAREVLQRLLTEKSGRLQRAWRAAGDDEPVERLVLYRHIPEFDWVVAAAVPVASYREPLAALQATALISLGLSLALFIPLSFLIGGYITRPLQGLIATFEQGARGDLSVRAETGPADELGRLAAYFNEFMARLEAYGRALRESEERYRSAMESTPNPIMVYGMDGRVSYCNPAFTRVFGWSLQDIQGERLQFTPPDLGEATDLFLDAVRRQKSVHGLETVRLTRDGERLDVIMSGALYSVRADTPMGMVVSMQDVTARRRAEKALQRSQEEHRLLLEEQVAERTAALEQVNRELMEAKEAAETATAAKSEFLANVSHEIRTPLNGIIGATELAMAEEAPPRLARFMEIVHASAESLLAIIEDILDFSRIEAGRMELEEQEFSLGELLQDVKGMFSSRARQKRIELLFHMDPGLPDILVGDRLRLKQVLTNLVGNAVKFTEPGGSVVVSGRPQDSPASRRLLLEFEVSDTGIGMDASMQERLFQPFTQADASTTRKYGGTGLGLSICKRLVELMGGSIGMTSQPGRGSSFTFTVQLGASSRSEPRQDDGELRGMRVLVVDDSPQSRTVAASLLDALGVEAVLAASPVEGLDILRGRRNEPEGRIQCLITDWLMPQMDGLALAKRAREEVDKDLGVLVVTAYSEDRELGESAMPHVDAVLAKPYLLDSLRSALVQACCKEKRQAAAREPAPSVAAGGAELEGLRILAAEDNPTSLEVLSAILENAGAAVRQAEDGLQAWELLHELGPDGCDVMLLDLNMPGLGGLELAAMVRRSPDFAGLPLVAITARADRDVEAECLEAGFAGYVRKPFSRQRLVQAVLEQTAPHAPSAAGEKGAGRGQRAGLPEDLAALQQVDAREAMERFGLGEEELRRILRNFRNATINVPQQLQRLLHQRDFEALRQQVHSLKGAAGSIGASLVFEAARELNACLTEGERDPARLEALLTALDQPLTGLLQSLQSLQEKTPPPHSHVESDSEELRRGMLRLREVLEAAQPVAVREALEELRAMSRDPRLERIEALAEDYEFQAAAALLQQLLDAPEA